MILCLFIRFNDLFHKVQVFIKRLFAFLGHVIFGIWFIVNKGLFHAYKILLFQLFDMCCKVPIGHIQELFQGCEVERIIYSKGRHNSKPHTALKRFM